MIKEGASELFKKSSNYNRHSGEPELIVGLDLGTSKVTVVVAEREIDGDEAQIIGVGQCASNGIRKGLIVNLEQAVKSVRNAVIDAQNMVGQDIDEVTVSFGGGDIKSVRSKGMISLGRTPRSVKPLDIERVIEAAQANVVVPSNQSIIHTIPVEYSLDGNAGIDDPLGMNAMRLDIEVQSIIVPTATVQNVYNCVTKAGLAVNGLVITPLVSALGVLSPEDALAGAVVVDIGGGTTSVAVFADGRAKHLSLSAVGGDHITNDLGSVLHLPLNKAEEIKRTVSLREECAPDEMVTIEHNSHEYSVPKATLNDVVRCRIEEMTDELICPQIKASKITLFPGGVLLTGGVAKTDGIDDLFLEKTDLPARVAAPLDANRMPPGRNTEEFSSAAGIIKYILSLERDPYRYLENPSVTKSESQRSVSSRPAQDSAKPIQPKGSGESQIGGIFDSIKNTFRDLF